jgi:hypothetical protein
MNLSFAGFQNHSHLSLYLTDDFVCAGSISEFEATLFYCTVKSYVATYVCLYIQNVSCMQHCVYDGGSFITSRVGTVTNKIMFYR